MATSDQDAFRAPPSSLAGEAWWSDSLWCLECDLCFEFRSLDFDLCLCFFSFFLLGSLDPDLDRWCGFDPDCTDLSLLLDFDRCLGLSLLLDLLSGCFSLLFDLSILLSLSCLRRSLSSSRAKSLLGERDRRLDGEYRSGLLLLYGDLLGDLDRRLLGDLDLFLGGDRLGERL